MSRARTTTASDSVNEIATVRIELRHTDPVIWRQVEVPTSITLKVLHDIIQVAMGWPAPGNIVMWRGLSRLTDIELGAHLAPALVGN